MPTVLEGVARLLGADVAASTWASEAAARAEGVARARRYALGEQDMPLTPEMRRLLRVGQHGGLGANYCETVLGAFADRLVVHRVGAARDAAASTWAEAVLAANRSDGLQIMVHEAALRDGETYVLADWDAARGLPRLTHEPAYDGLAGVLLLRGGGGVVRAAVKVWHESHARPADTVRANVYWPGRIEKYVAAAQDGVFAAAGGAVVWAGPDGVALGVPLAVFTHGAGASVLAGVMPLQDMLNRAMYSMTMAAELSAFPVRVARGFTPPPDLTVGMWLVIAPEGMPDGQVADVSVLAQGELAPYIAQCRFLIEQIYDVSKTPYPAASAQASGEALRQREAGLLSKVRRAQVVFGNAWEDAVALAARLGRVWGATGRFGPPVGALDVLWQCTWRPADVRAAAAAAAVSEDGGAHAVEPGLGRLE